MGSVLLLLWALAALVSQAQARPALTEEGTFTISLTEYLSHFFLSYSISSFHRVYLYLVIIIWVNHYEDSIEVVPDIWVTVIVLALVSSTGMMYSVDKGNVSVKYVQSGIVCGYYEYRCFHRNVHIVPLVICNGCILIS